VKKLSSGKRLVFTVAQIANDAAEIGEINGLHLLPPPLILLLPPPTPQIVHHIVNCNKQLAV